MGKVYLVGAGCGGYQLITLKGKKLLQQADCVIYDRLIDPQLLNFCPSHCELIYLGKGNTEGGTLQELINKTLVKKGKEYSRVVRLKGGDSFVFGRGGEELTALNEAKIPYEMVPGVSSSLAAPEFAGIPVTHRGASRSFHVFTAHFSDPSKTLDFETVAKLDGTLIFLMGVGNLDKIANGLMEAGKDGKTPVALIEKGARTKQRVIKGTLETIVAIGLEKKVTPPAIILVGDVADLREDYRWYEERPLKGKRILVTRAKGQEESLVEGIYDLGGEALHQPMLSIKPLQGLPDFTEYKWILFNSPNGVESFFVQLRDCRSLGHIKVGAVGAKTKQALQSYKIEPDLVPDEYLTSLLLEETVKQTEANDKILVITSQISPLHQEDLQRKYGRHIDIAVSHTTEPIDYSEEELQKTLKEMDMVTFLSGSAVDSFFKSIGNHYEAYNHLTFVSIGPKTSKHIEKYGAKVHIEARDYSVEGILEALTCLKEQED